MIWPHNEMGLGCLPVVVTPGVLVLPVAAAGAGDGGCGVSVEATDTACD
jgi:hypothetical protein